MKTRLLASVLLLSLVSVVVHSQELTKRLNNNDIIEMVSMGLTDDVIVEKIRSSQEPQFDTSIDAMKVLKAANVSPKVMQAMITPHPTMAAPTGNGAAPARDPHLPPEEVGIYWHDGSGFIFIEGQTVSNAKVGGRAAHYFSYGIASKKWNAQIPGAESKNRVKDTRPVFYFYAPESSGPADIVLVKLDKKGDHRQWEVGSIGGWGGGKAGTKDASKHGFDYERVAPRTYKITLVSGLEAGEYGLFLQTGSSIAGTGHDQVSGATNGRIYDFSIGK
jgi:hypothetical protein